ncbi:hypothetical protein [Jiangella alba]|uniref:hypothetical protein n=1 Tax=Jiangella alba TaxID=561176 RepID=UPI00114CBAA5|nr:hypothetical protein [Jiangella alba]
MTAESETDPSVDDDDSAVMRELTPAERRVLAPTLEAMRALQSTIKLSELSEFQATTARLVQLVRPPMPFTVLDHVGAINVLKGFDLGGLTKAAGIVAKADFWWNRQLSEVVAQIARTQATWLIHLPQVDIVRAAYPPNLRSIEDLGLAELEQVILVEGIPLYAIPRPEIAEQLVRAVSAAKRREILGRRWRAIVADCRGHLGSCRSGPVQTHVRFAERALDATESGHHETAQALAANLLDTILGTHLAEDRAGLLPSKKVTTPERYDKLAVREWLAFSPIWAAYQSYFADRGDPVPRTFNRHATAHSVGTLQFSRRNAVQALMLVCSLLGYLDHRYATAA